MKPTFPKMIFKSTSIQHNLHSFWIRTLFLLTCRFLWILQSMIYLIPHSAKNQLSPLLSETAKCSYPPKLCNDILRYFIWHTVLICPDSLQHGQNSYMGGISVKLVVLSVLFQGNVAVEILVKEGERWPKKVNKKDF